MELDTRSEEYKLFTEIVETIEWNVDKKEAEKTILKLGELLEKVSRVDAEVKVNFAELESIQYLNRMRELMNLGDNININARLLVLRRKIIDDVEGITKSKISA